MSETLPNGKPKPPLPPMIELPGHNGILMRFTEDDPYAEVDTTIRPADVLPRIQSEPTADLRGEQVEFQRGMQEFERLRGYRCFHWRDVLEAIHDLGYRKVAPSTIPLDPPAEAKS
jgi:hypothetical protein